MNKDKENSFFTTKLGDKEISVSLENWAEKVNGQALVRCGDTVVFAVATMSDEEVDKGFFPLSVSYEEKFYAAGKISGSRYTRREGKPSDRATLISRMIDRAVRPRFSQEMKREVQIIITCLSWDEENDPAVLGMIASSLALHVSDIPWNGPLGAVRIGKEENLITSPTYQERAEGSADMVVSGFIEKNGKLIINMVEAFFKEEDEESVMNLFMSSHDAIKELCLFQEDIRKIAGKEKISLSPLQNDEKIKEDISQKITSHVEDIFKEKEEREEKLAKLKKELLEDIKEKYEDEEKIKYASSCIEESVKKEIRKNILEKRERVDGREVNEVRPLKCSVGILPRTHGSGLFERGQTKSLSIITLGAPGEEQLTDDMELSEKKRFMHHYNFPSYSVGEVGPMRGPGRREIGHGMLAEKALSPLIPDTEKFPYTIRAVSEIISSNGSTSMASVCGTTLALMDAGVPIERPVAGISIGLVKEDEKFQVLTDIQGVEDHCGDMDFKVAGTEKGITAIQMDVKNEGIDKDIIKEALLRAQEARLSILKNIKETIPAPREKLSHYAPKIETIKIDTDKIGTVVGPKGKTINEIIEETGVGIDIDDSGVISVTSESEEAIKKAIDWIKNITREIKEGEIFEGKILKLFSFGAVVELLPGKDGLVHISEIANKRVEKIEDELQVGQTVRVKVIKTDNNGKVSLSIKKAGKD